VIERLRFVRGIGLSAEATTRVHDYRFQQFIREGRIAQVHQLGRYAAHRRPAILSANANRSRNPPARCAAGHDGQADRRLVRPCAEGKGAAPRREHARCRPLDTPVSITIEALETAQQEEQKGFVAMDEAVGWGKLQRVRGQVRTLAGLAEEDPLLGTTDRDTGPSASSRRNCWRP
jgi:hypothetical protein